jgi:hypothetical protein
METNSNNTIINKAAVGSTASLGAAAISILPQIEIWLRVLSLAVGLAVGIASLISIIRNMKKK